MKFLRPLLALSLLLIIIAAVWLWWSLPAKVDMANYAPADSLVYVEFNNLDADSAVKIGILIGKYYVSDTSLLHLEKQ